MNLPAAASPKRKNRPKAVFKPNPVLLSGGRPPATCQDHQSTQSHQKTGETCANNRAGDSCRIDRKVVDREIIAGGSADSVNNPKTEQTGLKEERRHTCYKVRYSR